MIATDIKISLIAEAVEDGLSKNLKRLPSWMFYDESGDKIFQRIMNMPEYYLTRCEHEILEANKQRLLNYFRADGSPFNIVELGAGDGSKTEVLLAHFTGQNVKFVYTPVDLSKSIIKTLKKRLSLTIPNLSINAMISSYEKAVKEIQNTDERKVFLFLGANIGNFTISKATDFLSSISNSMSPEDHLMVGFDLKKDPRLIQAAYDDPHGITSDFNLNLLVRINQELGGDFKTENFLHFPYYNPETGQNKSFLVSKIAQDVYFKTIGKSFHFDQWEIIHTEIFQKFDKPMIEKLASAAGLHIVQYFYDSKHYFCDVLVKKKATI